MPPSQKGRGVQEKCSFFRKAEREKKFKKRGGVEAFGLFSVPACVRVCGACARGLVLPTADNNRNGPGRGGRAGSSIQAGSGKALEWEPPRQRQKPGR